MGDGDDIEKPKKAMKGNSKGDTDVSAAEEEEKANGPKRYQKGQRNS
jgi:hypothetical protein